MEYLYREDYIEYMYKKTLGEYERGEIGLGHFWIGIPATIAYEYYMEYGLP